MVVGLPKGVMDTNIIPVEVSNRHVHLSKEHVEVLFGKGYILKQARPLSQPGEFAAEEKVRLVNGNKVINGVRIIGPERAVTQVELSGTDAAQLGMDVPLRLSGDIEGTPGITIEGPVGSVVLGTGVIRAKRHVHLSEDDARQLGLVDGASVSIILLGGEETGIILDDLIVRVGKNYSRAAHVDVDEWNVLGVEGESCSVTRRTVNKVCSAFLLNKGSLSEQDGKH